MMKQTGYLRPKHDFWIPIDFEEFVSQDSGIKHAIPATLIINDN